MRFEVGVKLKSLSTTAGYLERSPVKFADELTCIIGARGTCKSTIVETLRFAFDCDPERVKDLTSPPPQEDPDGLPSTRGLVRATLAGGTARCEAVDEGNGDSTRWLIEREVEGRPRVFRDGVVELSTPGLLTKVEIYSQGDLQKIAQHGRLRLELIDRPNRAQVDALVAEREDAGRNLRGLGAQVRQLRSAIESRRVGVQPLVGLRAELAAAQGKRPAISAELDRERSSYEGRRVAMERVEAAAKHRTELLNSLRALLGRVEPFRGLEGARAVLPSAGDLITRLEQFGVALEKAAATIEAGGGGDPTGLLADLRAQVEAQNQSYYRSRREQQEVNDALRKEDQLKQQIDHLQGLERELAAHADELTQVLARRAAERHRIDQAGQSLYELRLAQVEQINDAFQDFVTLTLQSGMQSPRYQGTILTLLQGSRLQKREEIAAQIAGKVRPAELVDLVEAGDAARLATLVDRDKAQMARVITALLDQPGLYDLEAIVFEDWLEITMFVDKVPKPINQLSKGQMATALLPLILRPADYPLIFDQPEDDLDNRFVYDTLVRCIRDLKQRRQLILVTHNANIPVLGDAEKVVVMSMASPDKAGAAAEGDVETMRAPILGLLEGGAEAFRRRQDKYGELLR